MKVAVLGSGYVGLVSGVCLAAKGHEVTCFDVRESVVEQLNAGRPHIYEEGLEEILQSTIKAKTFTAELIKEEALIDFEIILIAVGTPSSEGKINLEQIESAAKIVGRAIKRSTKKVAVLVKSTVVPGTTDTAVKNILEQESGKKVGDFGLGMNPEFLREGHAISDFMFPDRIVFGFEDPIALGALHALYKPWNVDKLEVNTRTAEMIKYANNFVLATLISTANEIGNLCYAEGGIDADSVMQGIYLDRRWSPILNDGSRIKPEILTYLYPGCGFGGSCFPKDVQAFRTTIAEKSLIPFISQAVLDVNDLQPLRVISMLKNELKDLKGKKVLVLGLAFKPNTDDVRESASLKFIAELIVAGTMVLAHDPIAVENAKLVISGTNLRFVEDWENLLGEADAVVIATKWKHYRSLSEPRLQNRLVGKPILDLRRMFKASEFEASKYRSIGFRKIEKE